MFMFPLCLNARAFFSFFFAVFCPVWVNHTHTHKHINRRSHPRPTPIHPHNIETNSFWVFSLPLSPPLFSFLFLHFLSVFVFFLSQGHFVAWARRVSRYHQSFYRWNANIFELFSSPSSLFSIFLWLSSSFKTILILGFAAR